MRITHLTVFLIISLCSVFCQDDLVDENKENIGIPNIATDTIFEVESSIVGDSSLSISEDILPLDDNLIPIEHFITDVEVLDETKCDCQQSDLNRVITKYEQQLLNEKTIYAELNATYTTCSSNLASTTIQLIQTEKNASNFDVHLRLAKNEIAIAQIDVEHCKLDKEMLQSEFNENVKRLESNNAQLLVDVNIKGVELAEVISIVIFLSCI